MTLRYPLIVVDDPREAGQALRWLVAEHAGCRQLTLLHVVDTSRMYVDLVGGVASPLQIMAEAESDARRALAEVRDSAPPAIGVHDRVVAAPARRGPQILEALGEEATHDAIVFLGPERDPFRSSCRLVRWLRARSPVPVIVPARSVR